MKTLARRLIESQAGKGGKTDAEEYETPSYEIVG